MTELMQSPSLQVVDGQPVVSSLVVAEHFGKRHGDVLNAIRRIASECTQEFTERNFSFSEYTDSTGRILPMFLLTRDGFSLIVMGFTGTKATAWKVRFLEAFNEMERELIKRGQKALPKRDMVKEACKLSSGVQKLIIGCMELEKEVGQLMGDPSCQYEKDVPQPLLGIIGTRDSSIHDNFWAVRCSLYALEHSIGNWILQRA